MKIPNITIKVAQIVRRDIFSFNIKKDNIGTSTYPKDSKMAISFNNRPLLIAQILMSKAKKYTTYAIITIGFRTSQT